MKSMDRMRCAWALGTVLVPLVENSCADNVLVRPWGDNALRIQISPSTWQLTDALPNAYLPRGAPSDGFFTYSPDSFGSGLDKPVTSGNIQAEQDGNGLLTIRRVSDSRVLLRESGRAFGDRQHGINLSITLDFSISASKMYGMGQNRRTNNGDGLGLNVINQTYSFQNSLGEEGGPSNSLPWVLGAEPTAGGFQFGVLFNSPSLGGVSFNSTSMTWSIVSFNSTCHPTGDQHVRQQFDFLITTHEADAKANEKPFQIIEKYVDAVGHAQKLPYPGYWHSRNRYESQQELLDVMRGFRNRSIPVDVIVIDWFHWNKLGDFSFNLTAWPDPKAMVDECRSYGTEIMVSVWAFTCPGSRSYDTVVKNNWFTTYVNADGSRSNIPIQQTVIWQDNCLLVDPTNADFRKYAWSLIESGYYKYGIKIFWLDASEPQGFGELGSLSVFNVSWQAGTANDIGAMFSLYWSQAIYDGLRSRGEKDIVILPRGGWVGIWRYGAVLWSGDINSDMAALRGQINIGLSAQMSGIPWWTTDIGGYGGGDQNKSSNTTYREIIIRWFQYGVTCPIFRQHGYRYHTAPWHYGPYDEKLITEIIKLREELKPYIVSQLETLNATGRPFNRPLMWDFPDDAKTWELAECGIGNSTHEATGVADQYMMGDDYMVAPILELGQRSRQVYFPRGSDWMHHFSGERYKGGVTETVQAPLETFPLFKRLGREQTSVLEIVA